MKTTTDYNPSTEAMKIARPIVDSWDWWVAPWLAALIDGEGSIMIMRRRYRGVGESRSGYGSWRPSIHVYNTCLGLIDATKAATGLGYVVHSHRDKVKESHKKDSYFWCIESGGIRFVAEAVLPFLIVKHRQAEILIEVRKLIEQHVRGHQNDEQIYDLYSEIKILNKTGRKEEEP